MIYDIVDDIIFKFDVWSFGILMWEIFLKGEILYFEVNMECDDFFNIFLEGIGVIKYRVLFF